MTYQGNQAHYSPRQPSGYRAPDFATPDRSPPELRRYARLTVVVLGLASYLLSYGPVLSTGGAGWAVRFAVLAGLLAVFDLLPQQATSAKVVAALAATGFLDALSSLITASDARQPGWALVVIVVLDGLQALAAIGALLLAAGAVSQRSDSSGYNDYYADYYARAAQYYAQYGQQAPQPDVLRHGGAAHAQQTQQTGAQRPPRADSSQYGSYSQYVGGPAPRQTEAFGQAAAPAHSARPATPPGVPNFGQAQAPSRPPGATQHADPERRPSPSQ
jgi:hypothetical protein